MIENPSAAYELGSKMPDDMQEVFEEVMAGFDKLQHIHEPCDGCIQRDKAYEHLAERFAALTSHTTELHGQITDAILTLGGYDPDQVATDMQALADRVIAEEREAKQLPE